MTLTQIGHATFNAAHEITNPFDGANFWLRIEELFQRLAHNVGPFAFLASGSALQLIRQCRGQP